MRLFVPLSSAALRAVIIVTVLKQFASPIVVLTYLYLRNKYQSAVNPNLWKLALLSRGTFAIQWKPLKSNIIQYPTSMNAIFADSSLLLVCLCAVGIFLGTYWIMLLNYCDFTKLATVETMLLIPKYWKISFFCNNVFQTTLFRNLLLLFFFIIISLIPSFFLCLSLSLSYTNIITLSKWYSPKLRTDSQGTYTQKPTEAMHIQ